MTTPQNTAPEVDPLAGHDKRPAVSFKDLPVGTVKRLTVESFARTAQTTVFGSNPPKLAYWPGNAPGEQGNPKMAVVFDVLEDGEEKSLWAPIPSSLKSALMKAQGDSGQRISPGGTLLVKLAGKKESGKGNPQNVFEARYEPGATPPPTTDALAGGTVSSDPWSTPTSSGSSDEPPF